MADEFNKRMFTTKQFFYIIDKALSGAGDFRKAKKKNLISKELQNHIMLVVTQVNGCEICSYKHTKDALEMGMSKRDIANFLSGVTRDEEESVALFFAQHYAEMCGDYSKKAWDRVVDTYGRDKAKGILAATRFIMMGNAYGIATGALLNRIKGKRVKKSKLLNELGITFSVLVFVPIILIKNIFK